MIVLPRSLAAWGSAEFETTFKAELAEHARELPLQQGLSGGSYALRERLDILLLSSRETAGAVEVKVMVFYPSLTPGCACGGDPTVQSELTERLTALVSFDQTSAEAEVRLLED